MRYSKLCFYLYVYNWCRRTPQYTKFDLGWDGKGIVISNQKRLTSVVSCVVQTMRSTEWKYLDLVSENSLIYFPGSPLDQSWILEMSLGAESNLSNHRVHTTFDKAHFMRVDHRARVCSVLLACYCHETVFFHASPRKLSEIKNMQNFPSIWLFTVSQIFVSS